jgi:hypothetical protein
MHGILQIAICRSEAHLKFRNDVDRRPGKHDHGGSSRFIVFAIEQVLDVNGEPVTLRLAFALAEAVKSCRVNTRVTGQEKTVE